MTGDPRLPNPNLGPLQKGPFYAVQIERVAMGVPTDGLPIDTESRVLDASDNHTQGLSAAGNTEAWHNHGVGSHTRITKPRRFVSGFMAEPDTRKCVGRGSSRG